MCDLNRLSVLCFLCVHLLTPALHAQGVSINPTGQPPHPGAMLDVNAPDKGFLVPRTQSSSILDPAAGMIIYDTVDMQMEMYNGMQWLPMMTGNAEYFWWADADGDGYGDPFNVIYSPTAPPFFVANSDDCDDANTGIHPAATEICDGLDNDCDGLVDTEDPGFVGTVYPDADGDGYGDADLGVPGCTPPLGFTLLPGDCDDGNAAVYPGAPEVCDGLDNDCNGFVDENDPSLAEYIYPDADGDGFGADFLGVPGCNAPFGWTTTPGDCDDGNADINPDAPDLCDGLDNDCDGDVDESGSCPDDGLPCTDEVCIGGACVSVPHANYCVIDFACYAAGDLNPSNACQVCDPVANQYEWTFAYAGVSCGSGYCDGFGNCIDCFTGGECEDGLSCTIETCDAGTCVYTIDPAWCQINGSCYMAGESNPENPCQVCDPGTSQTGWTLAAAGTPCPGGECDAVGVCVECITNGDCDDGLPCTIGTCEAGVCSYTLDPAWCQIDGACYMAGEVNPGNACEICDPATNQTVWTPVAPGTPCAFGVCTTGGVCVECLTSADCNDDLPCTYDICIGNGCTYFLVQATCYINGICYSTGDANPAVPCEVCDPDTDQYQWSVAPAGTPCAGGNVCDGAGNCVECLTSADCDDGLPCTMEICDSGDCVITVLPGNCAIDGMCWTSGVTNPNNPCQMCDPNVSQTAWSPVPAGVSCLNGFCDGMGNCDPFCFNNGDCDDGLPCTADTCVPPGYCTHTITAGFCNINNQCYSAGEENPANECQICDPVVSQTAWTNAPAGTPCSTGECDGNGNCD